jgi:predicted phosphohydrolase
MALEYGADQVIYAHCHGKDRFQDSFLGNVDGVNYRLVSSDYLKFKPERILP